MYVIGSMYNCDSNICFYYKLKGNHGDYGGKLAEGYFILRAVLGLGSERIIRFSAKELHDDCKHDSDGRVYKGLNVDNGNGFFEIVLPSGVNAYATTGYANGKNMLVWMDESMKKGLRGAHEARLGGNVVGGDAMIAVIDIPLTSISQLGKALKIFSECKITLKGFEKVH